MSTDFQSKVYKKQADDADYIGITTFLWRVARREEIESVGPPYFIDTQLSVLEYFGLLVPVAKILVRKDLPMRHLPARPFWKVTSPKSWAVWTQNGKKWIFSVGVKIPGRVPKYEKSVSGTILFKEDVDYWKAFRGIYPTRHERWKKERQKDFKEYIENPFDIPLHMVRFANEELDGRGIIPIYDSADVTECLSLLGFLNRRLPIEFSILLLEESQKRTRKNKRKYFTSIQLKETLWELVIQNFDMELEYKGGFPSRPKISANKYFYRNHYITFYVDSLHKQGMRINEACGEVAKILAEFEPFGEEPMDAVSIYKNIYNPIIKQYRPSK